MNNKLKVLDLFSGIGGFSLGLHSTGIFDTVKFVEFDKFCQKVLKKNFPNIPIEGDIKDVKGQEFEADVVVGGFPCQPMSVAGRQKGTSDNRYLWPEMFRLIKEIKPEFVIGENVQGIVNIQEGMVLRQVQDDLEGEGFEVQCFLIPASGIGAWHQRYRVWIVGHSKHNGLLAAEKRSRDKKINGRPQEGQDQTIEFKRTSGSRNNEDVSNSTSIRSLSKQIGDTRSMGEESKKEKGREGNQSSVRTSSRSAEGREREEDVSNTTILGTRKSRESNQEERMETSSTTQSNSSSKNVSDSISSLRGGWGTIGSSRENKVWRFCTEEKEQTEYDIWSQIVGRNVISGEADPLFPECERFEEFNISKEPEGPTLGSGGHDENEINKTWWQIESDLCGVPNGISYELDKDRANRIKTLGNAIVPQIARELGLAIKKVLDDQK